MEFTEEQQAALHKRMRKAAGAILGAAPAVDLVNMDTTTSKVAVVLATVEYLMRVGILEPGPESRRVMGLVN